jgi:hypothetical protein
MTAVNALCAMALRQRFKFSNATRTPCGRGDIGDPLAEALENGRTVDSQEDTAPVQ